MTRHQATPRHWPTEPRRSRWRDVLYAALGVMAFLALGIDDVRF